MITALFGLELARKAFNCTCARDIKTLNIKTDDVYSHYRCQHLLWYISSISGMALCFVYLWIKRSHCHLSLSLTPSGWPNPHPTASVSDRSVGSGCSVWEQQGTLLNLFFLPVCLPPCNIPHKTPKTHHRVPGAGNNNNRGREAWSDRLRHTQRGGFDL
jgi:hypothetical protein